MRKLHILCLKRMLQLQVQTLAFSLTITTKNGTAQLPLTEGQKFGCGTSEQHNQ